VEDPLSGGVGYLKGRGQFIVDGNAWAGDHRCCDGGDALDLRSALAAIRTRWWLLVAGLVIGGLIALVVSLTTVPQYSAHTQLFVSTTNSDNATDALQGSQFSQQRVSSYAKLLSGEVLAAQVVDALRLDMTPAELAGEVSATPVLDTVLIDVTVTDASPQRAQEIAQEIGERFPDLVSKLERPGSPSTSPVAVTVTQPADRPTAPSAPQTDRNILLGLLVGLVVGVVVAVARAALDRSLRDPDEASAVARTPVLGVIVRDERFNTNHVVDSATSAGAGEGYRQLRSNLQFLSVDNPPKVIMVTSAIPGQGKSTATVNLGVALAKAGRRVAVVEADLRKPMVTTYLGLVEGAGLTSVLTRNAELADVLQPWGEDGLSVVAAGPIPPNPGELLTSSHMKLLLDELRRTNDFVLIDTPPLLPVADATGLAVLADGVLLCARYGSTKREQLRQVRAMLDRVGARTLGLMLNAVPPRSKLAAEFGYQYTSDYRAKDRVLT
jgi:capsular exopolysaccharide synthesis family protein